MPRKKPFSGKQKKRQLQDKRNRKQDGPAYLAKSEDDDDDDDDGALKKPDSEAKGTCSVHAAGHERTWNKDGEVTKTTDHPVQKINQQPEISNQEKSKSDINSFRLHFFRESEEVIRRKKKEARKPVCLIHEKHLESNLREIYPASAVTAMPRRPPWNYSMSKAQLDSQEQKYFQHYIQNILGQPRASELSYFELNLETWRQLWRVLEISDILLIVADIRYPVLHVAPSLVDHVTQVLGKQVIILLNKIDLVPVGLALAWKRYLQSSFPGVKVILFSSSPRQVFSIQELLQMNPAKAIYKQPFKGRTLIPFGPEQLYQVCEELVEGKVDLSSWRNQLEKSNLHLCCGPAGSGDSHSQGRCAGETNVTVSQSDLSNTVPAPGATAAARETRPGRGCQFRDGILTVGCIGYPNAGKSSVMNAVVGRKVVSVSKSPGHTKHLQTIFLTPSVKLCDCPGLVFPSFVPKSLQVVAGIFPVAQVREPCSVLGYLARRLDLPSLLHLNPLPSSSPKKKDKNSGSYQWSPIEICEAFALKHGFTTAKAGRPDTFRAANKILRLAVEGSLCLSFHPPDYLTLKEQLQSDPEVLSLAQDLLSVWASQNKGGKETEELEKEESEEEEKEEEGGEEEEEEEELYLNTSEDCEENREEGMKER